MSKGEHPVSRDLSGIPNPVFFRDVCAGKQFYRGFFYSIDYFPLFQCGFFMELDSGAGTSHFKGIKKLLGVFKDIVNRGTLGQQLRVLGAKSECLLPLHYYHAQA